MLLRLLAAIDEGKHSLEGLKTRVDAERPPSTRTMRRYLAQLLQAGYPWRYDRERAAYRFEHGYSLRPLELSGNEVFGLHALRDIATSLGGNIGASMDGVAEKLTRVAGRSGDRAAAKPSMRVHLANADLGGERSANFETLQKAQRERQSVRFAYVDKAGKPSERHVDLYGFVVSSGRVYAVAHDRGRGAQRVFALDNISKPKIAPQHYAIPDGFDLEAFAARSVSGIMHSETVTIVTVRYSKVVARAAKADRVVRERTIREEPSGGVEIDYTVESTEEFLRWVLKWGAEAIVVGPLPVRAAAAALARSIAARYKRR